MRSKLTPAQKAEIKAKWLTGRYTLAGLAPSYSISKQALYKLYHRENWDRERKRVDKLVDDIATMTYLALFDHLGYGKEERAKALIEVVKTAKSGMTKIAAIKTMAELAGELVRKNEHKHEESSWISPFASMTIQELDTAIKKRLKALDDGMPGSYILKSAG